MKNTLAFFLLSACVFTACQKDLGITGKLIPVLPEQPYSYNDDVSALNEFMPLEYSGDDKTVALGRVIFYEQKISQSNKTSCASCHVQELGFATKDQFSKGFANQLTTRNSMSIVNAHWTAPYFWDERAGDLTEQVLMPIENHIEMGLDDPDYVVAKLESLDYYPELFEWAFGDEEINMNRVSIALSDFVRSLVSYRSKFDEGVATNFANFTPLELKGKELFSWEMRCGNCHNGPHFRGWGAANIGLEMDYTDPGRASWTGNSNEDGMFKIPSLRNIALTGPYMHDGRFNSLDEVLDHYNESIVQHPNLDWRLTGSVGFDDFFIEFDPTPVKLGMTASDKQAIIAFLHTLTDEQMISDQRYSNPFVLEQE